MYRKRERTVEPGRVFGGYEIVDFIGAGGMGEVYRAHDPMLGRDVALKLLPRELVADPERRARFEDETRAMAIVSHPNIVTIHTAGTEGGIPFIVTELLEGRTLDAELRRSGSMALNRAFMIAIQIAKALSSMHEKGVVHSDLKPTNIFLSSDDHVKILDFGLSRLVTSEWQGIEQREDTASFPQLMYGSAGYMSPEQVEGLATHPSSDIFSLGAVLYEMVHGKAPFRRENVVETLHATLKESPAETSWRAATPLATVVDRCLQKRPDRRYQSGREVLIALEHVEETVRSRSVGIVPRLKQPISKYRIPLALAVFILVVTISVAAFRSQIDADVSPPSLQITDVTLTRVTTDGVMAAAALSPDGSFLACATIRRNGLYALELRHVMSRSTMTLVGPGDEYISSPRFTFDGSFIYYRNEAGTTYRTPLLESNPEPVLQNARAVEFSPDGKSMAFVKSDEPGTSSLLIADIDGTGIREIAELSDGRTFMHLGWRPDGKRLIATVYDTDRDRANHYPLQIQIETGTVQPLPLCTQIRLAGRIITIQPLADDSGLLMTTDPRRDGQLWFSTYTGECSQLTDDPMTYQLVGMTRNSGVHAVLGIQRMANLWRIPLDGEEFPVKLTKGLNTGDGVGGIAPLPDGRIVFAHNALGKASSPSHLWTVDAEGSLEQLTRSPHGESSPIVSPDGRDIIYLRGDSEPGEYWKIGITGGTSERLINSAGTAFTSNPSRPAHWIYYTVSTRFGGPDRVYRMPIDGNAHPEDITPRDDCVFGEVSPDGKLLACFDRSTMSEKIVAMDSGEILRSFTVPGTMAGTGWTPSGSGLLYIKSEDNGDNIWFQPIEGGPPRKLTSFESETVRAFAMTPDEKSLICSLGPWVSDVYYAQTVRSHVPAHPGD